MKLALKLLIVLWMSVSLASFGGFLYLLPSYMVVGAFAQALKTPESPNLLHWFYGCMISSATGISMTLWLWRSYRKQYGKLWKSD